MIRCSLFALAALACATSIHAADADAGRTLFRQQCALCHSAQPGDNGGAQGPNLYGVIGRKAASTAFDYTKALRASHLSWDAATLDRFLASPTTVVPGTAMVIATPRSADRQNLIAYFQAVQAGTFKAAPEPGMGPPPGERNKSAGTSAGTADWKLDQPGRVHRIDLDALPPPFDSPSAVNFPKLVARPANAKLSVPPGFSVNVFAEDLDGARIMRVAPNGDVFISLTRTGTIKVLRPTADNTKAAQVSTFAQGLDLPFGLAFYPQTGAPQWLYVAQNNRVVRYPYETGDLQARGPQQIVVPELAPHATGGHFTRDIAFSPDGRRLFVSVGSASNVAENMPKKNPQQVREWDTSQGALGAPWGEETRRAVVLEFPVGTATPGRIFATGLRNCVSLTVQPDTGDLWCTVNERDKLGDNLVPDYSTRVKDGGFYGWPWYYMGRFEDPRLKGDRADLAAKALVPDVPYQAHSAALNLVFYTARSGSAAFPPEYVGDGFAVMHGSWNRTFRTGHKIVRVRMKDGKPTGEYQDFLVGFIVDEGDAWGRPVAAVVAQDGALLMSDDGGNKVYRIAYGH